MQHGYVRLWWQRIDFANFIKRVLLCPTPMPLAVVAIVIQATCSLYEFVNSMNGTVVFVAVPRPITTASYSQCMNITSFITFKAVNINWTAQMTPHSSLSRACCGVSYFSISDKTDGAINCIYIFLLLTLASYAVHKIRGEFLVNIPLWTRQISTMLVALTTNPRCPEVTWFQRWWPEMASREASSFSSQPHQINSLN